MALILGSCSAPKDVAYFQDTDVYSDENELVSDTNTICRHYIIEDKECEAAAADCKAGG